MAAAPAVAACFQNCKLLIAAVLVQESKARSWLLRAVQLAKGDNGDFWALLYKLESQYGTAESQKKVLLLRHLSRGSLKSPAL